MIDNVVERETHIHGKRWASMYAGYFSDRNIAAPYVASVLRAARSGKADIIVDLGGGTGFILQELVSAGIAESIRLINLDESESQLAVCKHPRVQSMNGSIQSLKRNDIASNDDNLMLICRSVLHYGGILLQKPWLAHLRAQMKPGEWFVHQSGCCEDVEGALALDVFFELAGVEKWLPHRDAIVHILLKTGFELTEDFPIQSLVMPSNVLAYRYNISPENMARIEEDLAKTCINRPDIYQKTSEGFALNFPYRVFACRAV